MIQMQVCPTTLWSNDCRRYAGMMNGQHLAEVHEKWADRTKGMKRRAAIGLIRKAKRRNEGLPESEKMKPVVEDPKMEFVVDRGLGKEAWRCNSCKTGSGEAVCGESFSQALKHQL
jgi:hypothetical protein